MGSRSLKAASYVLTLVVAFGLGTAVGQQSAPKDNKGLAVEKTVTHELATEIEGMKGWQLRLRILNLEPGGASGIHAHKDRPAVGYVIKGTLTEYRDGGEMKRHPKSDAWWAGKGAAHWAEHQVAT